MAQRVAIVGLGIMGGAYAKNLLAAGVGVEGCDPNPDARDRLQIMGGVAHEDLGDWIKSSDLVILALVSPEVLKQVAQQLAGILPAGHIVLEAGTFSLDDKRAAEALLSTSGITLLDCPVSGTGAQAATGDILMMMSGPDAEVQRAKPLVRHFTRKVIEAGEFGAGSQLKFVANHAVALHNTAAAETLSYADALGLDRHLVYDMLSTGAGQSRMLDLRMPLMIDSAYDPPTASLRMFEKDLNVIGEDIRRMGLSAPLFDCCDALYAEALTMLPETYDTASIFEVYRARRPQ